jgi:hypothetical protein
MQPTFTIVLNKLTVLMLWAVASRQAAKYEALDQFSSKNLSASGRLGRPNLSYPRDEADAAGIVRRSLTEIPCEGPADVGD